MDSTNNIHCTRCNKLLRDEKGPVEPYTEIVKTAFNEEWRFYCLDNEECQDQMNSDIDILGFDHYNDIAAADRSLLQLKDLKFNLSEFCRVENTALQLTFKVERSDQDPEYRYSIQRLDNGEYLARHIRANELDYQLQVLSIDKLL